MSYQGINIYTGPSLRQGFHRMGSRYGPLIDRDHFLGIDPLEDTHFTRSRPLVNVKENKHNYYDVEIALAGYQKKDIEITLHDQTLMIEGKKDVNKDTNNYVHKEHDRVAFKRSISIQPNVDKDRIEAKYEQGILTIRLHMINKDQAKAGKKIQIK